MILKISRYSKLIAWSFYVLFYFDWALLPVAALGHTRPFVYSYANNAGSGKPVLPFTTNMAPNPAKPYIKNIGSRKIPAGKIFSGGPSQPEMQAFSSVNANNMVDLFSGDFSYNIPLMDVGGYPVNLSYRGGIGMDQDASWVGLGWNINPGTITRNMRGLPDDFDGRYDSVKKTMNIKENKTVGVTGGANAELVGFPLNIGASLGVFKNTYKGWGVENGINASINSGAWANGALTGGLSIANNSQDGLTLQPTLSARFALGDADEKSGNVGTFSVALPYNSRAGLKGLQLEAGLRQYNTDDKNQLHSFGSSFSTGISFASPAFTPTITLPLSSRQFSFTAKVGLEEKIYHPNLFVSGYVSKQTIEPKDSSLQLPAYGYLHLQDGTNDPAALTDFNREKEIPYREKPAVPHIAVPAYTYDAFSITGEGTGGMFRAYRSDIGYVHDPFIRTKDASDRLSVDVGLADLAHIGIDLNVTRAFTQSGPWLENNPMGRIINFRKRSLDSESVYLRNPGEKSINNKQFYDALGGDDVVAVNLYQPGVSSSAIQTTNYLSKYHDKKLSGKILLTPQNAVKTERDKRTQVISYLSASEADVAGLSKYIESYTSNVFSISSCSLPLRDDGSNGTGLPATYYIKDNLTGTAYQRTDPVVNFNWGEDAPSFNGVPGGFPGDNFSIRWEGRIKAPKTGKYIMTTVSDDGVRLWINDSLVRNHWDGHGEFADRDTLNLVAGQYYKIKLEYWEARGDAIIKLLWVLPGDTKVSVVPQAYLFPPEPETIVDSGMIREKRLNRFRKANHISEIDVLNNDGRRYVYGIPVYNLKQEETTFNVDSTGENKMRGLVRYNDGLDNSTQNLNGKDHYFNREDVPAYAHSFLLTGIVSPDYVDVTGNGISDDDLGDAVRFNYSKVCGINNPFPWRVPYTDSASLSEGLKTENRDDKGNYVYGEKELWYLHSISSKTMVATFTTEGRLDINPINRAGQKSSTNPGQRLKEINLYSKAEFLQKGTNARPIKTVHFEYSYQLCPGINKPLNDSGKLTLKKVWFTYNNNKKGLLNPYVFHYTNTNPSYNTRANDRWSTYKDPLQNPGSTSTHFLGNDEYPYALQDSATAAANAAAWTLDSIYLPSGGSMKVDFESDDYAFVQNKRAAQAFKLLGLGNAPNMTTGLSNSLYTSSAENLYVYVKVSSPVSNRSQVYQKYLQGLKKLYFRLSVGMPGDTYGGGNESVPCYADLDTANGYGFTTANTIWVKVKGISLKGDEDGSYSPLAKAATQFLRLNLSSKAYPGSEVGENLDLDKAVKIIFSLAGNVINAFKSFDAIARDKGWASQIDTARTWVRLNSPDYKKYGGGHRVKRVTIYDNWDKMTQARAAIYGQEYTYTTKKDINGTMTSISSGVASYEPGIGGDENPFHVPIEYVEKIAPLGPVTLGYTEEPLAESLFPAAGIGYSKVRVRTINYKNTKSANGYSETQFYTAYDFPVFTDRTLLDDDTKKRFKPAIANFLRINAKHHVVLSQGFKIELNDMHGKLRSQASYSETDPDHPTSYTENFYKVEDPKADNKRLSNIAMVIKPDGTIDSAALIGKDAELMVDMREQLSITNAYNANINSELFTVPSPVPPFFLIPSLLNLAQREETMYRSVAVTKVIQRYGIVDSVLHIDKGSKISTKDIAYDSETGDALVTRTQNEFNDPIYSFHYPSHWAYEGMGLAYKNIGTAINAVDIKNGRIIRGLTVQDSTLFAGGDELIVAGRQKTGSGATPCIDIPATFKVNNKLWIADSSVMNKGPKQIYFIDSDGKPYNGSNVSLKVIRSGRRNMLESVGEVSTLDSVVRRNGNYQLVLNTASKIVNASSAEFNQFWQVEDRKRKFSSIICLPDTTTHCNDTIPAVLQDSTITVCFAPSRNSSYNVYNAFIHNTANSTSGVDITINPGFWTIQSGLMNGRLNSTGLWSCGGCINGTCFPGSPNPKWIGFSKAVYFPTADTMFIGMAGDNQVRVTIDRGDTISRLQDPAHHMDDAGPFNRWELFPYYFTKGYHEIKVEGWNYESVASFGAEIYNLTRSQLLTVDSNTVKNNTLFNTAQAVNQTFTKGLSCPIGYDLDTSLGHSYCIKTIPCAQHCDSIISGTCKSIVTDTTFNPYITGVLGNWRANKAYTYYASRAETDPTTATNLRSNGTFASFNAFWNFQSGKLLPSYDTSRWIWNSEKTLFNRKGMEVENKDPLGRYNAGLYGYNLTMPTAVIQNAHYRESGFDGFEDYGFVTQFCDTSCAAARHIDFSSFKNWLDTTNSHTGLYSLKLGTSQQASLSFKLVSGAQDSLKASIAISTQTDTCSGTGTMLKELKISNRILLPVFSPFQGQRMLFSTWVKEARDCKCATYDSNRVVITMAGSSPQSITFKPSGNVIEGWQRYESVFDIPVGDTSITVSLQSTGQAAVFFDDVRMHPFNANMKSFVFNPVNLRLMAELDENNYATYYEYDDDGTLIRVKKETERGIKTIKETRSALLKQ